MTRLADFVAEFLARHQLDHVFMVTGGAAMHLNDAIGRNSKIKYVCCHHEQACAMAAEGYFCLQLNSFLWRGGSPSFRPKHQEKF